MEKSELSLLVLAAGRKEPSECQMPDARFRC